MGAATPAAQIVTSRWRLHFADRDPVEITFSTAVAHDQALAYSGAVAAEPVLDAPELVASCSTCRHATKFGNCAVPVEAGIATKFEVVWHPSGGEGCATFEVKEPVIEARLTALLDIGAIDADDAALCRRRYATGPAAWAMLLDACEAAVTKARRRLKAQHDNLASDGDDATR